MSQPSKQFSAALARLAPITVIPAATRKTIAPRIHVADATKYYTLREGDSAFIEKIEHVFLYDANRSVHLCELTPSWELEHLYTVIHFADNVDEALRDELDQRYAYEGVDDEYHHVDSFVPAVVLSDQFYDAEDDTYDYAPAYEDAWESIKEHYTCNWAY